MAYIWLHGSSLVYMYYRTQNSWQFNLQSSQRWLFQQTKILLCHQPTLQQIPLTRDCNPLHGNLHLLFLKEKLKENTQLTQLQPWTINQFNIFYLFVTLLLMYHMYHINLLTGDLCKLCRAFPGRFPLTYALQTFVLNMVALHINKQIFSSLIFISVSGRWSFHKCFQQMNLLSLQYMYNNA